MSIERTPVVIPQQSMGKHKFVATETGGVYGTRIFCEYCGHLAYNSNRSNRENLELQKIAKEPCAI